MMTSDEEKETTTITLENCYGSTTITVNKTDMDMDEVIQDLVRPMLLAVGYHRDTVEEYLGC